MEFWTSLSVIVTSIIILVAAFVQTKISATAKDFRCCSFQTMGEWAKLTHRLWIWREVRFKIKFSTPKITVNPGPAHYAMKEGLEQESSKQYKFHHAPASGSRLHESELQMNASDKPWFLCAQKADPVLRCSWLALLQNTTRTNVQVIIEEKLGSFDYALGGWARPLATADRTSFLTLMSLFGVRWENKGKAKDLTGEGETCEISVAHLPFYGPVFVYRDLLQQNVSDDGLEPNSKLNSATSQKYYLTSEKARLAMFNCFDLGFAIFRTHDDAELLESLKHPDVLSSDEEAANKVVTYYKGANGWCPGLSESITCWAEQSMPKILDECNGKFKSMFSAVPARSLTTGTPQFVAMLLGTNESTRYDSRRDIPSVGNVTAWAEEYLQSFPEVSRKVKGCLKWAATWSPDYQNNIVDPDIPWSVSLECLHAIRKLDEHLEDHLLADFKIKDRRRIKSAISNQQIKLGSSLFTDAREAAETHGSPSWVDELDRVGAENYEKVVTHLVDLIQDIRDMADRSPLLARSIVINRLMRGSLWVVHNGNAPDQYKRVLECSLSSSLLERNSIVYIT